MKVLLSGPVNSYTGYGQDILELSQALLSWGVDLYIHPSSVHPPIPDAVAKLLTKPIPEHVDLLISHRCPQELAASAESAGLYATSTVSMAWSMWEWDSLDCVDQIQPGNCEHSLRVTDVLAKRLTSFDVIMAYDEVSKKALDPYHENVQVLQGGVDPLPYRSRDWSASPFRFCMVGALSNRKNPFAAIQAFKALRDEGELVDAELVLKTTYGGLHPAMEKWCDGLKIIGQVWSVGQVHGLYTASHALLAPSWGEGKNRPAIEFATSGGAVAATRIGGHAQWMSSEYSWDIPFELKEQFPGSFGASVTHEGMKQVMLDLYSNRQETARRAQVAARSLPGLVSWERVLDRLQHRLKGVAGDRGQEVAALMSACRRPTDDSRGVQLGNAVWEADAKTAV